MNHEIHQTHEKKSVIGYGVLSLMFINKWAVAFLNQYIKSAYRYTLSASSKTYPNTKIVRIAHSNFRDFGVFRG